MLKTTPLEDLAKMSEELGEMFGWCAMQGFAYLHSGYTVGWVLAIDAMC